MDKEFFKKTVENSMRGLVDASKGFKDMAADLMKDAPEDMKKEINDFKNSPEGRAQKAAFENIRKSINDLVEQFPKQ